MSQSKSYQRWSDIESQLLVIYYDRGESDKDIGQLLSRSVSSVKKHTTSLLRKGLLNSRHPRWSEDEISLLIKNYNELKSYKELANLIGRPASAVREKLRCLRSEGLVGSSRKERKNLKVDGILELLSEDKSYQEIADELGISDNNVRVTVHRLRSEGMEI